MYSRVARAKLDTTKSDEIIRVAEESVATNQRLPGFQSVTFHYDRASGWGYAVSLWDTKEHADAAADGTRSVNEAFAPFITDQQPVEAPQVLEVIAQG